MKTFGKYAGYVILGLVLTLYFMFLTFPYESMKDRFLPQWEENLPYKILIHQIRATPLLWMQLSGVRILQKPQQKTSLLDLSTVRIRPAFLDLLIGKPALRVKTDLYNGSIKGKVGKKEGDLDLDLSWKGVNPETHPFFSKQGGVHVHAGITGELLLRLKGGNLYGSEGTLSMGLKDGSVKNLQLYGFTLPSLQGITGKGRVQVEPRKATLETLSLESDQISVSMEGNLDLSPRLSSSRLNLKGKIKLAGDLEAQYQPMLSGFLRNKDPEGYYTFSLRGTVGNPRFSF